MIEERAAERRLEEVVGDRIVRMSGLVQVRVHRERLRVVDALRQADGVAPGRVAILPPAVELVLLLVEAVHDVAGAAAGLPRSLRDAVRGEDTGRRAGRVRRLDEVVDRE